MTAYKVQQKPLDFRSKRLFPWFVISLVLHLFWIFIFSYVMIDLTWAETSDSIKKAGDFGRFDVLAVIMGVMTIMLAVFAFFGFWMFKAEVERVAAQETKEAIPKEVRKFIQRF